MSWMQKLYETYENCASEIGKGENPLLPVFHTTQQAHIEVVIDDDGNWRPGLAKVITSKDDMTTIIPCTEESSSRTSGLTPHPLFDKLQYIAGDFEAFCIGKKGDFTEYIEQLSGWCASPYSHPKVVAVLRYLEKGCLIADLVRDGILYCDENNRLLDKWTRIEKQKPPIFTIPNISQQDAFVRFRVVRADGTEDLNDRLWADPSIWQSYINYRKSIQADCDYCYVLGKKVPVSVLSPKKIRNPGDGAKLISSNDTSGFTFRGRFGTASEAFCVGSETTEKAHNALRWLISKQGYRNGDQVVLAWGANGEKIPGAFKDSLDMLLELEPDSPVVSTREEFAHRFNNAVSGYGCYLKGGEEAIVMGMDSATQGRLSIFYYKEKNSADLFERIENWHKTCAWLMEYRSMQEGYDEKGKPKYKRVAFVGAPSPSDIIAAAYGSNVTDKLKKSATERLLPCIIDGARLPADMMKSAARRASNPMGREAWEVQKSLSIACALIRKFYNDQAIKSRLDGKNEEVWKMSLDVDKKERDYLFGRALAYAQQIESYAINQAGENRSTNAERLQEAFCQHPAKTWMILYHRLLPYLNRLGSRANRYKESMLKVISEISPDEFDNSPLTEIYLLGYSSQMQEFYKERQENMLKKQTVSENEKEGE